MAWQIVRHAFIMVFGNFADALKVSAGPILIAIAIGWALLSWVGIDLATLSAIEGNPMAAQQLIGDGAGAFIVAVLVAVIAYIFIFSWIAVAWHRFILLEEFPGLIPAIAGRPIGAYIGKSFVLGLILMLILLPASMVAGVVLAVVAPAAMTGTPGVVAIAVNILLAAFITWVWLRFAIALPGTAVNRPLGLGASWAATAPLSGAIFGASLILLALNIGIGAAASAVVGGNVMLSFIVELVLQWATLMIGASMLTTIYGHVIENRPLR